MREEDDAVICAVFLKRIRQTAKFTETAKREPSASSGLVLEPVQSWSNLPTFVLLIVLTIDGDQVQEER